MKKRIMVLGAVCMMSVCFAGCGVKQTKDTVTVEAGQELELKAQDFFNVKESKAGDITFDITNVDTAKVGEYEATAAYGKKNYTIKVKVEDTTAPVAVFSQRYIITNDAGNVDLAGIYEAEDYSNYEATLVGFERTKDLEVLDNAALEKLTDAIVIPSNQEELAKLPADIPTEEGIYRAALAVQDACGNRQLEEIYLILDKTGARIEDVADKTIEVAAEDIDKEPEIDASEYVITDNVDGKIKEDHIVCGLELADEENHKYLVHVSYTDRAGNESKADFTINVAEKQEAVVVAKAEETNAGSTGGSSGNSSKDTGSSDNGGGGETGSTEPAPEPETSSELTPEQQTLVNAGYYSVININGGYYVMVPENESDYGFQLIEEYLASIGYGCNGGSGGWISSDKDQYVVGVDSSQIYELAEYDVNEW